MSKDAYALQFRDVSFSYVNYKGAYKARVQPQNQEHVHIVENLHFYVNVGEFVSIIGPSGSGKSTIFRLISGLEQPLSGEIIIDGKQISERLGKVGYMPQHDLLLPWRTILENAALPLEVRGITSKKAQQEVLPLLKEFGLDDFEHRYPNECSGGMRQRVSFLRAIMGGNNVLLLDEPFSALDSITRLNMQEWLLKTWSNWKKTILFITHDVEEALFLADRIFIIKEQPIKQLQEIKVPVNRPRTIHDLAKAEIVHLKQDLLELLRAKVKE